MNKRIVSGVMGGAVIGVLVVGGAAVAGDHDVAYPVNQSGQSYGSQLDAALGAEPDLVLVVASNGREGYVDRLALEAATNPDFTSPAEALAWQDASAGKVERLPVFLLDGKTQIGEFEVSRPTKDEMGNVQETAVPE